MNTELKGLHHVTAMTNSAERNYEFITKVLGMRLVKKTVNQDDIHTYHTFFADDVAAPGTDLTFFDFPKIGKNVPGTNSISRIGLRVPNDAALEYYQQRFEEHSVKYDGIKEVFGTKVLPFEEEDGQRYQLFSDQNNHGIQAGIAWKNGPVPKEYAINALGPIEITVSYFEDFRNSLVSIYDMEEIVSEPDAALLEMGEGGNGGRVILRKDTESQNARQGYGGVHHVAFRVENTEALNFWINKYEKLGLNHSGHVDRFYFEATYARIGHILIELSTDGPGFLQDEDYEHLGEKLSLPPFLEERREYIENTVRPFDTIWKG